MKSLTFLENEFCSEILEIISKPNASQSKFKIISTLVSELFEHKNSKEHYDTLSNLIVTSLITMQDKYPVDKYSRIEHVSEKLAQKEHIETLREENKSAIKEFEKCASIGKEFLNLVNRISKQYRGVANFEFCPKTKDN